MLNCAYLNCLFFYVVLFNHPGSIMIDSIQFSVFNFNIELVAHRDFVYLDIRLLSNTFSSRYFIYNFLIVFLPIIPSSRYLFVYIHLYSSFCYVHTRFFFLRAFFLKKVYDYNIRFLNFWLFCIFRRFRAILANQLTDLFFFFSFVFNICYSELMIAIIHFDVKLRYAALNIFGMNEIVVTSGSKSIIWC